MRYLLVGIIWIVGEMLERLGDWIEQNFNREDTDIMDVGDIYYDSGYYLTRRDGPKG